MVLAAAEAEAYLRGPGGRTSQIRIYIFITRISNFMNTWRHTLITLICVIHEMVMFLNHFRAYFYGILSADEWIDYGVFFLPSA